MSRDLPMQRKSHERNRLWPFLHACEDLATVLALAVMVLLPVWEMAARKLPSLRISAAAALVQHLTLFLSVLGGAIAARENRLLTISSVTTFLKGGWKTAAMVFSNACAAAVSVFLCLASTGFALVERGSGRVIAYGLPTWVVLWLLPLGFGLVALRLLRHAASGWRGRFVAIGLCLMFIGLGLWSPLSPAHMKWPAVFVLLAAAILGAPIFSTIGGLAVVLFWASGTPISAISVTHYSLVVNPFLPALPLFTLAGYFLAEGGAARRLVRVFQTLFGAIRGGPAIVTALVCAFFTSFTGASGVTILALGGLLMPVLLAAKYSERNALGLLTGAGSLGLLFPPCLPLILYAIISSQAKSPVTINQMFLGGILPGLLLVGLTASWGIAVGRKQASQHQRFDAAEAGRAIWQAKWELLLPVVTLFALFSGFATTVEAAAITALYAFVVETFVYGDLGFRRQCAAAPAAPARSGETSPFETSPGGNSVVLVMTECGLLVGGVLLILGVANGFTNYLVDDMIPAQLVAWTTRSIQSPWVFLLLLNLFLIATGCLMDVYSAIVIVVPLIVPIGKVFNIDPVHLGIIFLANLELGFLTPPIGMNLFLASYRFKKSMPEVMRSIFPMLLVLLIGVLLITYVPPLTTLLPRWLGR